MVDGNAAFVPSAGLEVWEDEGVPLPSHQELACIEGTAVFALTGRRLHASEGMFKLQTPTAFLVCRHGSLKLERLTGQQLRELLAQ